MKEKLQKNKAAVVIAAVACVCIVLLCVMFVTSGRKDPLREQLDLGSKYLDELNYDAALASFLAAIEIDPMNPEGYAGAAEAYVGLDDLESAVDILREGVERTQDAGLSERLKELEQRLQEEEEREEQERREQAEREQEQEEAARQSESAAAGAPEGGEIPVVVVPENTDDPFVEFLYAPYSTDLISYNIEDAGAAASFADSVGGADGETHSLDNGLEYYYQSGEFLDDIHDVYNGVEVDFTGGSVTTSYLYVEGVLESVSTSVSGSGSVPETGGFSAYIAKYGYTSSEEILRSFGIEDERLYTALASDNASYVGEVETSCGTVSVDVLTYKFDAPMPNRNVSITFPEDSGLPWRTIQMGEGYDAFFGESYLSISGSKREW